MTHFRPVSVAGCKSVSAPAPGNPPDLFFLPIDDLVIDTRYQRDISERGWRNIHNIAERFNWAAFSPVVVAPTDPAGRYSIIDGQHRCHAALLAGIKSVPCQIVEAREFEQARAFEQINANVTAVPSGARFHALALAGDEAAQDILAMAQEAGVLINRYPISSVNSKERQTNLSWQLGHLAKRFGRVFVVRAMKAVVESGSPSNAFNAGMLKHEIVGGGAAALTARKGWDDAAVIAAYRTVRLIRISGLAAHGRGQAGRLEIAAKHIGEALDAWRREANYSPKPMRPIGDVVTTAKGISLPRLRSLEKDDA